MIFGFFTLDRDTFFDELMIFLIVVDNAVVDQGIILSVNKAGRLGIRKL